MFLSASAIEDVKKEVVIGPQTYKLLKSLVVTAKPGEKDYTQLAQVLKQ